MIYRVKNKSRGPVQLAIHSRDGNKTEIMVLPWKGTFDIPEERFSSQIESLENKGLIVIEKITKK